MEEKTSQVQNPPTGIDSQPRQLEAIKQPKIGEGKMKREQLISFFASKLFLYGSLAVILVFFVFTTVYFSIQTTKQIQMPSQNQPPAPTISTMVSLSPPQPASETANWKTYVNENLGFEMQYPGTWIIDNSLKKESSANLIDCFRESSIRYLCLELLGSSEYYSMHGYTTHRNPDETRYVKEIDRSIDIYYEKNAINIYIPTKKIVENILGLEFESFTNSKQDQDTIDQILSTFQFISQTPTPAQTQVSCTTNTDCPSGQTCRTEGPLVAGQTPKKVCVGSNQVVPL